MSELRECPFCGEPVRWCNEGPGACGAAYCDHVHCDNCGMHFELDSKEAHAAETLEESKQLTTAAWNRRASEDRIKQQSDRLAELLYGVLDHIDPRNHQSFCECDPDVGYQCAACTPPAEPIREAYAYLSELALDELAEISQELGGYDLSKGE